MMVAFLGVLGVLGVCVFVCLCVCVFVCLCCVRCYRFNIDLVTGCREIDAELPFVCKNIFCVYTFNEKEYNTKNIGNTKLPCFDYSQVHAVQTVNETFIQTIQTRPFRVHIYVTKEQEHGNGEEEGETKEQEAAVIQEVENVVKKDVEEGLKTNEQCKDEEQQEQVREHIHEEENGQEKDTGLLVPKEAEHDECVVETIQEVKEVEVLSDPTLLSDSPNKVEMKDVTVATSGSAVANTAINTGTKKTGKKKKRKKRKKK
jgi:hypothetical protein